MRKAFVWTWLDTSTEERDVYAIVDPCSHCEHRYVREALWPAAERIVTSKGVFASLRSAREELMSAYRAGLAAGRRRWPGSGVPAWDDRGVSDGIKKRDHGDGDPDAPRYRELLGLIEQMRPPRPMPARLFVGRLANEALRMVSTPAQGREWDSWWVYGVQVVLREDFDWRVWQLWSSDGEIIRAGTVE